jgi:hypothetical protein
MATTTRVQATEYEKDDGTEQKQYRVTIPRALAESQGLEGVEVEWEVASSRALTIRVVDE